MVIAMLAELPQWSRYKASTYGKGPKPPELTAAEKKQVDWYSERRMWTDLHQLVAGTNNTLQELLIHLPRWKRPPELVPIGPPEWRGVTPWDVPPEATVSDVYAAFGFAGAMATERPSGPRQGPTVDDIYRRFGGAP